MTDNRRAVFPMPPMHECPRCHEVKDVGHGPLCWDCYAKTATQGDS